MAQESLSTRAGELNGHDLGNSLDGTNAVHHSGHAHGQAASGFRETAQDQSHVQHVGQFGLEDKSIGSTGSGLTEKVAHHHGHSGYAGQEAGHSSAHSHLQQPPLDPAVAAGLGAGHHDKEILPALHGGSSGPSSGFSSGLSSGVQHDSGLAPAIQTGSANTQVGGTGLSTSQKPFDEYKTGASHQKQQDVLPAPADGSAYGQTGVNEHGTGAVQGAGLGLGAAGAAGAAAGVANAKATQGSQSVPGPASKGLGTSSGAQDPLSDLKQELKSNQEHGTHSSHDLESKGPHGLVWSDAEGKYVHQRELDGKGSTGVDIAQSINRDL